MAFSARNGGRGARSDDAVFPPLLETTPFLEPVVIGKNLRL
jgi:hypothetical protein